MNYWSRKQRIGDLNVLWAEKGWEIAEAKGSAMDPEIKAHYLNDLEYEQYCIEQELDRLEHEQGMLPLKLMFVGFVIFALAIVVYRISY